MIPYSEVRETAARALLAWAPPPTRQELRRLARLHLFRSRILRQVGTPAAHDRRRTLVLVARAYFSILRQQRAGQ